MLKRGFRPALMLGLMMAALAQPAGAQIGEEVQPRANRDSLDQRRRELERHRDVMEHARHEMEQHRGEMEKNAREMHEALVRAYTDSSGHVRMYYRDGALDSARYLYRTSLRTTCARMGIAFEGDDTIIVREVMEGSGAAEAGIREGDIIISMNGERANGRTMAELAEGLEAGDRVRMVIRRDGRERSIDVTAREDVCPYRTMLSEHPFRVLCFTQDSVEELGTDEECKPELSVLLRNMDEMREGMRMFTEEGDSGTWFKYDFDGLHGFSDSMFIHLDSVRMSTEGMVFHLDSLRRLIPFTFQMADSLRLLMPQLELEMRENAEQLHAHGLMLRSMELGARALAGASITDLNDDLAEYFEADRGVLVTRVEEGTPAARAGLRGGDVIVAVNGNEVNDLGDVHRHAARAEGPVELTVMRRGERRTVRLAE